MVLPYRPPPVKTDEKSSITPAEVEIRAIRKKLKHLTFEPKVAHWLDTHSLELNAVLGSCERGIAYGKIIELFGKFSHGKTLLAMLVVALAQQDKARVAWVDLENSMDPRWAKAQGIDYDWLYLFRPQIGKFPGDEELRLQTAQELFQEVEQWMVEVHGKDEDAKMVIVIDSTAAILVEEEAEAGLADQSMRTGMARAAFLSKLLRRWVALAQNYNVMMIFINHLLFAPVAYGSPKYTPGGDALKLYSAVRVEIRRKVSLLQRKRLVGLSGMLLNVKNKAGEGSLEGESCEFTMKFEKKDWKFFKGSVPEGLES